MRLFVGLEVDEAVRGRAAAIADAAARVLSDSLVVRWVPPENLHVTLWFLGELAETRAAAVLAALDQGFPFPSFSLGLGGLGAFPSSGIPRVVWLGVRDGTDSIANIHGEIAARLQPLGFAPSVALSQPTSRSGGSSPLAPASVSRYPTTVERCPGRGGRVPD